MKRYAVSYGRFVNELAAKDGFKFHYGDRTDNPEEVIKRYEADERMCGLQIKDSQTKEVIYSHRRKVRGALLITCQNEYGTYTMKHQYVSFEEMREKEKEFTAKIGKSGYYATIVKVEREIYG